MTTLPAETYIGSGCLDSKIQETAAPFLLQAPPGLETPLDLSFLQADMLEPASRDEIASILSLIAADLDQRVQTGAGHPFDDYQANCEVIGDYESNCEEYYTQQVDHTTWTNQYRERAVEVTTPSSLCAGAMPCRWHESAKNVGAVSADGHIFTKTAGAERLRASQSGNYHKLSSICMIYDGCLRCGGLHRYNYQILSGEIGAADGAGFVFDSKVRRSNLQRMRSVFLNNRGQICLRDHERVQKLNATLPRMEVGMWLSLMIDLENLYFHFTLYNSDGVIYGMAEIALGPLLGDLQGWQTNWGKNWQSGFFCAIVTKDISVSLD
jgi:hypothetical protein